MDSEKFFEALRDKVNEVRAAQAAIENTAPGTVHNLKAIMSERRLRDDVSGLISRHPDEFVGLVLALARQVNDLQVENRTHARMNERIARLEAAMFDSRDNIDTPLGCLQSRVEYLGERIDNAGIV